MVSWCIQSLGFLERDNSLVPALKGGACQGCLDNSDPLAFSSRNSHLSVDGIVNAIHDHNNISKVLAVAIRRAVSEWKQNSSVGWLGM